jgi:hypothetical protein
MGNPLEQQKDVVAKLKQISDSFIEPSFRDHFIFRGTANSCVSDCITDTLPSTDNLNKFVNSLLRQYTDSTNGFKNAYLSNAGAGTVGIINNVSSSTISLRRFDCNSYIDCNVTNNSNRIHNYISNSSNNIELSLKNFVNSSSFLYSNLNEIRHLYSALDETNYQNYVYNVTQNPSTLQTVSLVNYNGNNFNSDSTSNTNRVKTLITSLRSSSPVTTNSIIGLESTYRSNLTISDETSNYSSGLPREVRGDYIAQIVPSNNTSFSSFTLDSIAKLKGSSTPTKKYVTYSLYAKMRASNAADVRSAECLLRMTIDDATRSSPPTVLIKNTSVKYSTDVAITVGTEWKRFSITRDFSLINGTDTKVGVTFYIDNAKSGSPTNQFILISGSQVNVQEEDEYGILPAFQPPIFDETKTNRIVVRRLLLMYELLATFYIAVSVWKDKSFTEGEELVNIVYDYMTSFNRNVIKTVDGNNTFLGKIGEDVSNRFNEYQTNNSALMLETSKLKDNQYSLKDRISMMNSEKQKMSKTYTFMIISLVIFLIVTVACLVIFSLPIERGQKITAAIGAGGIGIVSALVLYFVYNTQVESFQLLTDPNTARFGSAINSTITIETYASVVALEFAKEYLDNTINIALMLQTYVGYGNINQALNKERLYFDGVNKQLSNAGYKVGSVANAYSHEKYTNRARVSFFVNVTVLIALTAILLITLNKYPYASPTILTLSAIMLFLSILFYLLDVSARVRTAATKMYWGVPNISTL